MTCRREANDEQDDGWWRRHYDDEKIGRGKDPSVEQMKNIMFKASSFAISFRSAAFHRDVREPDVRLVGNNAIRLFLKDAAFPEQRDELNCCIATMVESIKTGIADDSRHVSCAAVVAAGCLAHVATTLAPNFQHVPEFDTFCSLLQPLWIGLVDNQGSLLHCFLARMSYMSAYMKNKAAFASYYCNVVLCLVMQHQQHDEEVVGTVLVVLEEFLDGEWLVPTFISLFWDKGAIHLNSIRHCKQILSLTGLTVSKFGLSVVSEAIHKHLRSSSDIYISSIMEIVRNVAAADARKEELVVDMQKLFIS